MSKPTVVCLCGSTRFKAEFERAVWEESLAGNIVLTVACFPHSDPELSWVHDSELKPKLDVLHLRKIDLSDEILVLNVGQYTGYSTQREIVYAKCHGKRIRYLEPIEAAVKP